MTFYSENDLVEACRYVLGGVVDTLRDQRVFMPTIHRMACEQGFINKVAECHHTEVLRTAYHDLQRVGGYKYADYKDPVA